MRRPFRWHRLAVAARAADDERDGAYWRFCRCAKAPPVTRLQARRAIVLAELLRRERRRHARS